MRLATLEEMEDHFPKHKQPRYGLLYGSDQYVRDWVIDNFDAFYFTKWNGEKLEKIAMPINAGIAIIDNEESGGIVGAILFDQFNGSNIELSVYGPNDSAGMIKRGITPGLVRTLALMTLRWGVSRVSMRTSPANTGIIRGLKKIGFIEESIEKDLYGVGKDAVRLVIFRDQIERLCAKHLQKLH